MEHIECDYEYNNADGVKESKHIHPTLKQVQKQLRGFDESLVMYVYHYMNGRTEEAQSYLEEWKEEQEEIRTTLLKQDEIIKQHQLQLENDDNKIIS